MALANLLCTRIYLHRDCSLSNVRSGILLSGFPYKWITSGCAYIFLVFFSRYIFFSDKVEIQDITKKTCLLILVGPKSDQVRLFLFIALLYTLAVGDFHLVKTNYCSHGMPTDNEQVGSP